MDSIPQTTSRRKRLIFNGGSPSGSKVSIPARVVVYALVDPRDQREFYIGMTDNLYARFKQHISMTGRNTRKQARIQEILDASMLPWMVTLEIVSDDQDPRLRELAWIAGYISHGYTLLNAEVARKE